MIERQATITNLRGLHARAAARFIDTATPFHATINIKHANAPESSYVDAKSIMSLMLLAAGQGTVLSISADGDDELNALDAICELIFNGFDEDD